MTPTADLMKLVEKWPLDRHPDPHTDAWTLGYLRAKRECADELQAALTASCDAQYPEDSDISVSEDGTLHVDLCRDGSPKRQLSILVQKDGAVEFAVYCEGRGYHGSVNDPSFIAALADYSASCDARVGGEVEAIGWVFQHADTGHMSFCPNDGINTPQLFQRLNSRHKLCCPAYATPAQPKASTYDDFVRLAKDPNRPKASDEARDAARYRWLRQQPFTTWKRIGWNTWDDQPDVFPYRNPAIDAAMTATLTAPGADDGL